VRSIYAAWEGGDWSSVDWARPEIEYVIADGPSPGIWTGPAGMADRFHSIESVWEDWSGRAEDYRELDGERVLVGPPVSKERMAACIVTR
jgi:hypothetical protein